MRIDWVILCRYAEIRGGTATIVGAGVDTYKLESFPGEISLGVVVRFVADHDEMAGGRSTTYAVRIQGPDPTEKPISEMEDTLRGLPGAVARPGGEGGRIFAMTQVFQAEQPGIHLISYILDGKATTVVFSVDQAEAS